MQLQHKFSKRNKLSYLNAHYFLCETAFGFASIISIKSPVLASTIADISANSDLIGKTKKSVAGRLTCPKNLSITALFSILSVARLISGLPALITSLWCLCNHHIT